MHTLVKEHQPDPYDYTALDLRHDLGMPQGPRGEWSRKHKNKDGTETERYPESWEEAHQVALEKDTK